MSEGSDLFLHQCHQQLHVYLVFPARVDSAFLGGGLLHCWSARMFVAMQLIEHG